MAMNRVVFIVGTALFIIGFWWCVWKLKKWLDRWANKHRSQ